MPLVGLGYGWMWNVCRLIFTYYYLTLLIQNTQKQVFPCHVQFQPNLVISVDPFRLMPQSSHNYPPVVLSTISVALKSATLGLIHTLNTPPPHFSSPLLPPLLSVSLPLYYPSSIFLPFYDWVGTTGPGLVGDLPKVC